MSSLSNERIPFIFIDAKELKCYICNKKVTISQCKCKLCMKLYCSSHLKKHKSECIPQCRICWTIEKVSSCNVCNGGFCSKHKLKHDTVAETSKYNNQRQNNEHSKTIQFV